MTDDVRDANEETDTHMTVTLVAPNIRGTISERMWWFTPHTCFSSPVCSRPEGVYSQCVQARVLISIFFKGYMKSLVLRERKKERRKSVEKVMRRDFL